MTESSWHANQSEYSEQMKEREGFERSEISEMNKLTKQTEQPDCLPDKGQQVSRQEVPAPLAVPLPDTPAILDIPDTLDTWDTLDMSADTIAPADSLNPCGPSDAPPGKQASCSQGTASPPFPSLSTAYAPQTDPLISSLPERKNWIYALLLTLAMMVGGLSSVCIKQLLLPIQVSMLAPTSTNTSFTLVASAGAFAGLLASPLSGALSDRTTLRWGRRRPWIVFGILATVSGMLLMAGATSIPPLLIGEILAQVGVDTILATVTALLPDQVPPAQRSLLAAFVGLAPNVGGGRRPAAGDTPYRDAPGRAGLCAHGGGLCPLRPALSAGAA